jgi:c-di-AMP phosphodiesterase-like protein
MKTIFKKVLGVILIIIGLIALFTPFTPGSWLALIGLELVGIRRFIFRKCLTKKQQAAAERYMKKFSHKTSDRSDAEKSKKTTDATKKS